MAPPPAAPVAARHMALDRNSSTGGSSTPMTMKSVDLPHLRSVVLAGHAGAGKTTLAEQLMFKAGAIPRLGRVDDGTAHLDFEPEVVEGFAATDGAILVMDASAGVEAGLEQAVAHARATNTAACFFINKCDRENAN